MFTRLACFGTAAFLATAPAALAQQAAPAAAAPAPAGATTVCGQTMAPPAAQPPAGSAPVFLALAPCFASQDNTSLVDIQTYLYYIQLKDKVSRPMQGIWTPYDDSIEQTARDDFKRLMGTGFLDNLSIETEDYNFSNGVVGKIIVYNMEERQRIKIVDYVGSKKIDRSKIDDKLKEQQIELRLDTFLDLTVVRKVEAIVRDMMVEQGFQSSEVTHEIVPITEGSKLVHLTFHESEGPKVKISEVNFTGNTAMTETALRGHMKENKPKKWWNIFSSGTTYQENKYEADAQSVTDFYRDNGYITAQVGDPKVTTVRTSDDGKTRWVELSIPVQEGQRYKVGDFTFDGNTIVKTTALRPLFNVKTGDYYDQSKLRKGFEKAQEIYGAAGYMDFTGYPDPRPRDLPDPLANSAPAALAAPKQEGPPVVDVTVRLQEGKQFFINRITFIGNTTTRDNVVRREMRVYEEGVFNTEALKYSVRRLNQLGYFKPLDEQKGDVNVQKTDGVDNKVDVKLKLEEQNRNQIQFGAGVSQFEGFFGQLSFQTANFLGRGETLTLSLTGGSRANNYSLGFTEPFLFDRNITGSANVFRSEIRYVGQFTQLSTGGTTGLSFPIGSGFTRGYIGYSYERVRVFDVASVYSDQSLLQRNPFLADALLESENGERIISRVSPSLVQNSLDQPIFPTTGHRITLATDLAGLGGNTNFYKPNAEVVWYLKESSRMSLGMRGQFQMIHTFDGSNNLPIFEKIFLGGEYTIRGFDLRTVGPQDPITGVVLGGDKSLLFNVEQSFAVASPVRIILFYDAGQVRDYGQPFSLWEPKVQRSLPPSPLISDALVPSQIFGATTIEDSIITTVLGRESAFRTSTGLELRFFMPVLNVPFRLIFAYNPQRGDTLDANLQPQSKFSFHFAVGTMF